MNSINIIQSASKNHSLEGRDIPPYNADLATVPTGLIGIVDEEI